jgi:hypothetical protein
LTGEEITGEVDFTKVVNPFGTYARRWEFSPHLQFVKLDSKPESFRSFVENWGVLEYHAYEKSIYLSPSLRSLRHPLYRRIELLKCCRFQISLVRLRQAQKQLRAVVTLWRKCRQMDPNEMRSALDDWLAVYKLTFEKFVSSPVPLIVNPRALQLPMERLGIDDLLRCVQGALSRSFMMTILGLQAPFLCLEPVYQDVPKSRVQEVVGNRMHYHVNDILSAMWVMVFADITRGLAEIDCANGCGTTFTPTKISQRFCCTKCANAYRARISYLRIKQANLLPKSKRQSRSPK